MARSTVMLAAAIAIALVLPLALPAFYVVLLIEIAVAALFATAFNLLMGFGGMVSFGHAAYFALGAYAAALLAQKAEWPMLAAFTAAPLLFPRLLERRNQRPGSLSGGEQQMLTIARTLMGSPEVLLLDEPFEGLAPLVVDLLAEQLGRLKAEGLTMVVTEQNVRFVSELGDRVYVLERGTVCYCGTMSEFLCDDDVRRTYLAV